MSTSTITMAMPIETKIITFAYSDKDERAWNHPSEGWATEADWAFISAEFRAAIEAHPEFHGWTMTDPKWKACTECGEMLTNWWEDGYGETFCSPCFKEEGHQCDGCWDEACVQCNEDEDEE